MIVKDEAHVIERCLRSVRPFVDAWTVVDTGSTDGTQQRVRAFLADLPGALHERPWRGFAHNRTEALELARGTADYLLVIDADEELAVEPGFVFGALGRDGYQLLHEHLPSGSLYQVTSLLRAALPWRYQGVLHEVPVCAGADDVAPLQGAVVKGHFDSARNRDPQKYLKDATVLEQALAQEPGNARYVFYLAQSFRDAQVFDRAVETYLRRAQMGGWAEEIWYSLFQAARLSEPLQLPPELIITRYLQAYELRPHRAETLCSLASYYRRQGRPAMAWAYACAASSRPMPADALFVDPSVYRWRALDERAVAAFQLGSLEEAREIFRRLLDGGQLPEMERARVRQNLQACTRAER